MLFAVVGMSLLQMLYITMLRVIRVNLNFYPVMYLFTLVFIIASLRFLYSDKELIIKRLRSKNEK